MKKIYLLSVFIFLLVTAASTQVIPNGGFELWETNGVGVSEPTYWESMNLADFTNVFQEPGHNSTSAARLSVEWDNALEMYVTSMLFFDGYFPVDKRFTELRGYYKGTSVGGDSLTFYVGIYSQDVLIGYGMGGTNSSAGNWTSFSVSINYMNSNIPDKAFVAIHIPPYSGVVHAGTTFTVDDLDLYEGTGPNAPVLVSAATNTAGDQVEMNFNEAMADPAGSQCQFTITHNGSNITPTAAALKNGFPQTILLTLGTNLQAGELLTAGYAAGSVTSAQGMPLASFSDFPVTNNTGGTAQYEWIPVASNTINNLWSVYFTDAGNGWVAGEWATALHSVNGGKDWSQQNICAETHFLSVHATTVSKVYLASMDNVYASNDAGANWTPKFTNTSNTYFLDLFFLNQSTAWTVGNFVTVDKTTDGGDTWNLVGITGFSPCDFTSVHFRDASNGWAVGDCGVAACSSNGGVNWDGGEFYFSTMANFKSIFFINSDIGWIVGDSGIVMKTTNGGGFWNRIETDQDYFLNGVIFIDANTGWAAGDNGLIIKSTDGGLTWTEEVSHTTNKLRCIYFIPSGLGWAVGDNGTILRYASSGTGYGNIANQSLNTLHIYPNPSAGHSVVAFQLSENDHITLDITDVTGKVVEVITSGHLAKGDYKYNMDSSGLENGLYFCRLISDHQIVREPFIVNK